MKNSTMLLLLFSVSSLMTTGGSALAQDEARGASFTEGVSTSPSAGGSYYGGGYYGGGAWRRGQASTAQEGMARGMADVIRSRGQAAVDVARATTESERARRAYMENRNFAAQSFVENRRLRDEYRKSGLSSIYKDKEKLVAYFESKRLQPLTKSEFYEGTGAITWPNGLLHPHDENGRKQVEALFAKRAQVGTLESVDYVRLNKLLRDWINHIPAHKAEFSSDDMKDAVRFLRRLEMDLHGDFS